MAAAVKPKLHEDKQDFLLGPNLCSQVGNNVSTVLRAALVEKCKLQGGQLAAADIEHVFELVLNSEDLFPIYQEGHKTCTSMRNSKQFSPVGPNTLVNFILGAFCNDVLKEIAHTHRFRDKEWRRAIVQGFADFLTNKINTDLQSQLFSTYKKLVVQNGKSMSAVTITSSEEIVEIVVQVVTRIKNTLPEEPRLVSLMNQAVNDAITRKFGVDHSAGGWIDESTIKHFITLLLIPTQTNRFRQTVLQRMDGSLAPLKSSKDAKGDISEKFSSSDVQNSHRAV